MGARAVKRHADEARAIECAIRAARFKLRGGNPARPARGRPSQPRLHVIEHEQHRPVQRFDVEPAIRDEDIVSIHGPRFRPTSLVGDVPLKARRLVDVTYECLMIGLEQAKPGNRLGDIASAIQRHAEGQRYTVVRDFCGHGVGRLFHDSPEVVHAGRPGTGPELKPGMFFTVEPMINIGRPDVKLLDDGWTAVTRDRSLSAQFEHSIGITEEGCEIFTKSPKGLDKPPYA